jgi:protein-tyrosine phosphatase
LITSLTSLKLIEPIIFAANLEKQSSLSENICESKYLKMKNRLKISVLFVCSGNYYRSRYAEYIFNHRVQKYNGIYSAESRGIGVFKCNNEGPISKFTIEALVKKNIPCANPRMPIQISEKDIQIADLVIGLKKTEHYHYLLENYKSYSEKFRFWEVHDLDFATPEEAFAVIDQLVDQIFAELGLKNE